MTLIQDVEYMVSGAIQDTIGNELLLGILLLFVVVVAFIMIGLSLEAGLIFLIPITLTVLLMAGVGVNIVMVLGLIGGVLLYLGLSKIMNR